MLLISDILEKKLRWLLGGVFIVSLLYSFLSYSLTDPNLILISWEPYWDFQQWMWQNFFHNRQLLAAVYSGLVGAFFLLYLWGLKITGKTKNLPEQEAASSELTAKKLFTWVLVAISPLLFSYNALSHDVFNYIFNAKMVAVYHADPHQAVALDFVRDPWTRFMHNTHTPAPYGYGWTGLSLLPYFAGFGKFFSTWLVFRLFALLSLVLLFKVWQKIYQKLHDKPLSLYSTLLVFLNPLLLIEVISNQHNDLWMMAPALASFYLLLEKPKKRALGRILLSLIFLAISISIKFATAVLIPLWVLAVMSWWWGKLRRFLTWPHFFLLVSLAMFIPLFSSRSQQFLPWYLAWAFIWLPLIKESWWKAWLIILSLTGLLRYVPWILAGEHNDLVLANQKWMLWGVALDRKSTRLNSSHSQQSRMPSSA